MYTYKTKSFSHCVQLSNLRYREFQQNIFFHQKTILYAICSQKILNFLNLDILDYFFQEIMKQKINPKISMDCLLHKPFVFLYQGLKIQMYVIMFLWVLLCGYWLNFLFNIRYFIFNQFYTLALVTVGRIKHYYLFKQEPKLILIKIIYFYNLLNHYLVMISVL